MSDNIPSPIPDISIVIVSWNTRDLLVECIESVYRTTTLPSFDIWVVDNASSDDSVQVLREKFPEVKVIQSASNVGFGKANNRAIKASKGKTVLLLNSDVVLTDGALDTMWRVFQEHPQVGVLGCTLIWPDGGVQDSWHTYIPFGPKLKKNLKRLPDGLEEALLIWAAFLLVRREVYDQVGVFDEDFVLFYEDFDWCWRVHKAGITIACYPEVRVLHGSRKSAGKLPSDTYWRWMFTAEYLLFGKHHSPFVHKRHMTRKLISYTIKMHLHWWVHKLTGSQLHADVTRRFKIALSVIKVLKDPKVITEGGETLRNLWTSCERPESEVESR